MKLSLPAGGNVGCLEHRITGQDSFRRIRSLRALRGVHIFFQSNNCVIAALENSVYGLSAVPLGAQVVAGGVGAPVAPASLPFSAGSRWPWVPYPFDYEFQNVTENYPTCSVDAMDVALRNSQHIKFIGYFSQRIAVQELSGRWFLASPKGSIFLNWWTRDLAPLHAIGKSICVLIFVLFKVEIGDMEQS
ncbi:vam6/Vps39-like protein [Cinnamomum micranthum f. kanehirae]|uniref:Vam6/Vps39-like protein n=1 Tax=Cinnamomum micranthum f. kanehirae TaxID=337451 RepID=A0A3S3PU25_9MAGN|nr:vam6/Vps39-like protein [Cinnamomum micranthum f. kanehirae]